MTDEDLIARALGTADSTAIEALYLRHREAILRATRAVLGPGPAAEDAAQGAFLHALSAGAERAPTRGVRAWLVSVARRFAIDAGRSAQRRRTVPLGDERPAAATDTTQTAERREFRAALLVELRNLPPEQREPVLLRFFGDCSLAEIGVLLGVSKSTVQHRYESGLAVLRRRLQRFASVTIAGLLAWLFVKPANAAMAFGSAGLAAAKGATMAMASKISAVVASLVLLAGILAGWYLGFGGDADGSTVLRGNGATPAVEAGPTPTRTATSSDRVGAAAIATAPFAGDDDALPPAREGAWRVSGVVVRGAEPAPRGSTVKALLYDGWQEVSPYDPLPPSPLAEVEIPVLSRGRFVWDLDRPGAAVTIILRCDAAGHRRAQVDRLVRRGEAPPTDFRLVLAPLDARLAGRVLDADGQPVPEAVVETYGSQAISDPAGKFSLPLSSRNRSPRIQAWAAGHGAVEIEIEPSAIEGGQEVDVRLARELRVKGRVIDPEGQPIREARVTCWMPRMEARPVDGDGGFEATGLAASGRTTVLYFTAPGFVPHFEMIETESEAAGRRDIVLHRSGRVAGIVVDEQGNPLEGVQLSAGNPDVVGARRALTNAAGAFAMHGVPIGRIELDAFGGGIAMTVTVVDVPAASGALLDARIVARRGRVVTGIVRDEKGAAVAGISLILRRTIGDYLQSSVRSDAEGRFRLEGIPSGVGLEVEAYGTGYCRVGVPLPVGSEELVVNVRRAAGLAGTVVDAATRAPIPSFRVRIVQALAENDDRPGSGYAASLTSSGLLVANANGIFRIDEEELEAGAVFGLEISAPGFATATRPRVPAAINADPAAIVFELEAAIATTVRVVDATTQDPIAEAAVRALDEATRARFLQWPDLDAPEWIRSNARGEVAFGALGAGETWFEVRAPARPPKLLGPYRMVSGAAPTVLPIAAGATIRGLVLDEDRKPLKGVPVAVSSRDEGPHADLPSDLTTDDDGRFVVVGLAAGTYDFHRRHRFGNFSIYADTVGVQVPDSGTVDVTLAPSGTASVTISVDSAEPLPPGSGVRLDPRTPDGRYESPPAGRPPRFAPLISSSASFRALAPGPYDVVLLIAPESSGLGSPRLGLGQIPLGSLTVAEGPPQSVTFRR